MNRSSAHATGVASPRLAGLTALIAIATTVLGGCPAAQVSSTATLVDSAHVRTGDTTFVGDNVDYPLATYWDQNAVQVVGIDVGVAVDQPSVLQLVSTGHQTTAKPPPTVSVSAKAIGTARITMTANGVHFVNNVPVNPVITVVVAPTPTQVELPASVILRVGERVPITAGIHGGTGGPQITRGTIDWTAASTQVAHIDGASTTTWTTDAFSPSEVLVGAGAGTTTLTVTYHGPGGVTLTNTIAVYVLPPGVARVVMDTNTTGLGGVGPFTGRATLTLHLGATLFDATGNALDPRAIQFVSRDPAAATIAAGVCPMPGIIPAECGGSVVGNLATILQRAARPVTFWVVATAGSAQPDSVLISLYPAVASLDLSPLATNLSLGASVAFTLIPRDGHGVALPPAAFPIMQFISDFIPEITGPARMAHVTQQMVNSKPTLTFTFFADSVPDNGQVTLQFDLTFATDSPPGSILRSPTATIVVNAVDHVNVTPASSALNVGLTSQFTATPVDGAGRSVTLPLAATWRSSAAAVATVSATGLVTAVGPGTATIFAAISGVEGGTQITTQFAVAGPPAGIVITPTSASKSVNATQQFVAYLVDAQGNRTLPAAGFSIGILTDASGVAQVQSSSFDVTQRTQTATVVATGQGTTNVRAFYQNNSNGQSTFFAIATITVTP